MGNIEFKLRPYQEDAHNLIIKHLKEVDSLLVVMSTGAGKSKMIASFVDKIKAHYNFLFVVYKKDLVNQLATALDFFDLNYSVIMAGDSRYNADKNIQVCSIDTLHSRKNYPFIKETEKKTIIIIDEADDTLRTSYQELITAYKATNNFKLIGLTATAYDRGLPHFDRYIIPVSAEDLRDKYKTLVDFKYILPKPPVSFEGAEMVRGEFSPKFVDSVSNSDSAIMDSFKNWLRYGDDRQTLIFCSSVDHATRYCAYINNYFEKEVAVVLSASIPSEERKKVYSNFVNGLCRFILNVRLVTRGIDLPEIGCIVDDALTASVNNHLQKLGRGSRINPFYPDCIVIDMVGNNYHNMPFYYPRKIDLHKTKTRTKKDIIEDSALIYRCEHCFRIELKAVFIRRNQCPFCKGVFKVEEIKEVKLSNTKRKELEMGEASPEKIEQVAMINFYKKELWKKTNLFKKKYNVAKEEMKKTMINKYGLEKCKKISGVLGLTPHDEFYFRGR